MSCKAISSLALAKTIPVNPPAVKRKINPITQDNAVSTTILVIIPCIVESQLKILMPVGIAINIVTLIKYVRVPTSIPLVNM